MSTPLLQSPLKPLITSSHPDVVSDSTDGYDCVSGQEEVFRYFFSQGDRTQSVQIAENHLPLRPVGGYSHTHTFDTFKLVQFTALVKKSMK